MDEQQKDIKDIEKNPSSEDNRNKQKAEENTDNSSTNRCESRTSFLLKRSIPKRYVLLFMTWLGFINIYAMRVDLNVAIVGMVNDQEIEKNGVIFTKVRKL